MIETKGAISYGSFLILHTALQVNDVRQQQYFRQNPSKRNPLH